ncbi:MAG: EamA family transporter [Clostridia bacterium]|nr:EamA family transporter [Clostridia bacterium]
MVYFVLVLGFILLTSQNIVKKKYQQISTSGVCFFSAIVAFCAMIVFASINRNWSFDVRFLLPIIAFAISYACATVGFLVSIRYGSLANSSLVLAYSLLIPTFYGIFFLHEPVSVKLIIGLVLIAVSLWLSNSQGAGGKITWKWVVFILIGFFGNGMCSTIQRQSILTYGEENIRLLMACALSISSVLMLISSFVMREKEIISVTLKKGWYLAVICGVVNACSNLVFIYLNGRLPASVMFPVLSGGNLITVFLYSLLFLKESFSKKQYVGFFLGVAAVVILNL